MPPAQHDDQSLSRPELAALRRPSRRQVLGAGLGIGAGIALTGALTAERADAAPTASPSPVDLGILDPDTPAYEYPSSHGRISNVQVSTTPRRGTDTLPGLGTFNTLGLTLGPQSFRRPGAPVTRNPSYNPAAQPQYDVTVQADGRPLTHINNQFAVHPSVATRWIGVQFGNYQGTADKKYLDLALKVLMWLYRDAAVVETDQGTARFTRYHFNWPGADQNPWYSAFGNSIMVQQCLNAYLYTGEAKYLGYAKEFFTAYIVPRSASDPHRPWISKVENGWLWFDENPLTTGAIAGAINAMVIDWYGIRMYYGVTGDELALRLTNGMFATMDHLCSVVRRPGECSWYDEYHHHSFEHYHPVNIGIFSTMHDLTGWLPFLLTVEAMLKDHPMYPTGYPVWVGPNSSNLVRRDTSPVPKPSSWRNVAAFYTGKDALTRTYDGEGPARWLKLRYGPMGQYYVKESSQVFRVAKGDQPSDQPEWWSFARRPATVRLPAMRKITAYAYNAKGQVTATRTGTWTHGSVVQCTGRARIRGIDHFYISNGQFTGMWIPMSQGTIIA